MTEQKVDVKTNIAFVTGWTFDEARSQVEAAIEEYFAELAEQWADQEYMIVRIAQIEMHILNLSCVVDVMDTTLNGYAKNLEIDAEMIPALGSVEVI